MDTLEDRLQEFGRVSADAIDGLMALMPCDPAVAGDSEAAAQFLQQYTKLVGSIGQIAWESGLEGLHSVCVLVETNLMLLQSEARALRADEIALVEGWPMLLFGYMANRADPESATALLQSLTTVWPMPLAEESFAQELQQLVGQAPAPAVADDLFDDALLNLETQQVEREMLAVLVVELEQMSAQFNDDLSATAHGSAQQRQVALENFREQLERLGAALGSVGLGAAAALFAQLGQHLAPLHDGLTVQQQALLQQLPVRLASYLANPNDEQAAAGLAALLADMAWTTPLDQDALTLWQGALANVQVVEEEPQNTQRQSSASAQDVSLALPGDVNPELLDGLLQELPVQVGAFTAAIARIADGQGGMKDAERAMRAAHTLKGAANTVGVPGIANLTHHLEDILVALIDAQKLPQRALADVLVNAGDCLEAMNEFLLGLGPAPEQAQQVLQEVLDCANRIDREGVSADAAPMLTAWEVPSPQPQAAEPKQVEPQAAAQPAAVEQSLRVPAPVVDELLRLAGETLISNSQIQEHLRQTVSQAEVIRKQQRFIQQLVAELEELVDIRGITSSHQAAARKEDGFDALEFEHYSELHTATRRLIEAATDAQEMADMAEGQLSSLEDLLGEQHRLQMANQHALMRTRMVAVSTVVSRLQRGVRQTGRLLDKDVELTIKGENTTIDSNVLNDLMDPLMHILRNAVDHGIESPETRLAACKPQRGRIELSFAREGNSIVVRCSDDGAGLDYAAIRRFAERKGMLKAEHEHTEEELARLILAPGFSTREHASQVSGRGVGMDVVYSRVLEMKGMLALNSRRGQGLMVELRLPATLLSAHTLIVRQHNKLLAISSRGVEDIRYVAREMVSEIGDRQYFREGDEIYSLVRLEKMLSLPPDQRARDKQGFPVLLTRLDDGSQSAVLVQEIIDSREVVMKKFGRYVPRTQGVIGAVILGDGSVAPVIDLVELQHVSLQPALRALEPEAVPEMEYATTKQARRALVVDDSLSARRSLVQVMKDAGFEVRTANDGMDAVNVLTGYVPDIILTDMEMPRMNGLELTANVRHSERTKQIPIIMITSRSTEKHRQMSAAAGVNVHLIKPFSDDVLLQHVSELTGR